MFVEVGVGRDVRGKDGHLKCFSFNALTLSENFLKLIAYRYQFESASTMLPLSTFDLEAL